jgi:hypothetical protein
MTEHLSPREEYSKTHHCRCKIFIKNRTIWVVKLHKANDQIYLKRKTSGVYMFNVQKQWEKIQAAARIIAEVADPSIIVVRTDHNPLRLLAKDPMVKELSISSLSTPTV